MHVDSWLAWPWNLCWFIPAWCVISAIVGVLLGLLMEAGDYRRASE